MVTECRETESVVPRYLIDVPRQMKHCLVLLAGSTTRPIEQVGLASKRSDWGVRRGEGKKSLYVENRSLSIISRALLLFSS